MLDRIKEHPILSKFIKDECSEQGVSIQIDNRISQDSYIIISPDEFYNSLKEKVFPSVDCIVIQKCNELDYKITLIELKSIRTAHNFVLENMIEKFQNTLANFISVRFKENLFKNYKTVDLYFVSNIELHNIKKDRDLGLKLEYLISKRFEYNGKRLMLRPKMPIPTIKPCY